MATSRAGKDAAKAAGLSKSGNRNAKETVIAGLLFVCAAISILTTLAVVFALTEETISFFREVSVIEFFTNDQWTPLFMEKELRHCALSRGHVACDRHCAHRWLATRFRGSDLPLGVRRRQDAAQNHPYSGDFSGHPYGRFRLLRAPFRHAYFAQLSFRGWTSSTRSPLDS